MAAALSIPALVQCVVGGWQPVQGAAALQLADLAHARHSSTANRAAIVAAGGPGALARLLHSDSEPLQEAACWALAHVAVHTCFHVHHTPLHARKHCG